MSAPLRVNIFRSRMMIRMSKILVRLDLIRFLFANGRYRRSPSVLIGG